MMIRNSNKRGNYPTYSFVTNDEIYNSFRFSKMINYIMQKGKKELAKKLFYEVLDKLPSENKIEYIDQIIDNLSIHYDIRRYKAGGTTYSIPFAVTPERDFSVCARLLVDTARRNARKNGRTFQEAFVSELNNAFKKTGDSYKHMQQQLQIVKQNMPLMNMFRYHKKK